MADPASVVQQGTESILSAYRAKGAANANLGGAVASGIGNLGVGIFRQAQKAKEEKEIASIDEAIKSSQMLGDPAATAQVLSKMQGGLRTERGRRYLLESIEGFRKTVSTLLDDKYKQSQIDWNKARAADEGKTETAKAERSAADKRWWTMYGSIFSSNPRLLPPQAISEMPDSLRDNYAAMVQGAGVRDTAAKTAEEKAREKLLWNTARAQGLVPVRDPDTGEVTFKPDVTSERFKAMQEEREKNRETLAAERAERRAFAREARDEDREDRKGIKWTRAASAAGRLFDEFGDPKEGVSEADAAEANKIIIEAANALGQDARQFYGGGRSPTVQTPEGAVKSGISNPDGSVSSERSITIEVDGTYYNIPTIRNGKQLSEDDAIRAAENEIKSGAVKGYKTVDEAVREAKARSGAMKVNR